MAAPAGRVRRAAPARRSTPRSRSARSSRPPTSSSARSTSRVMEIDASSEPLTERLRRAVGRPHPRERGVRRPRPPVAHAPRRAHRVDLARGPRHAHARARERRQLYAEDLPARSLDAALDRFLASIASVREFGKLGAVVFPFPSYFTPGPRALDYLEWLRGRGGDVPMAIELRHRDWVAGKQRDATMEFLSEHQLAYVCVDVPPGFDSSLPPLSVAHHRHRVRQVPRPQHRARGNAAPTPATTGSRTTTRTPTSSRGSHAWRSSQVRRGRCT